MYKGNTLENIQEVCRIMSEQECSKDDYALFSSFRKNFMEKDLFKLLDDVGIISETPGDMDMNEIDKILATPTGTIIDYVEYSGDEEEDVQLPRKQPTVPAMIAAKEPPAKKSSFKSAHTSKKSKENTEHEPIEDEFLKEFDPEGKFTAMVSSLIVNITDRITFDDIAGLTNAKQALKETVILPILRPDIFVGLRAPARGILLFGPPGTGKTFLAKVAACECHSTFFSVSASSMTSKWIGESEKLVRVLFAVARAKQPSIIFIDEIDSLLSSRSEDDKDNLRGLKTEFLVQLDGMSSASTDQILVIAATNRPNSLDEAARRRFTRRIYIGLPNKEARLQIIKLQLKNEQHSLTVADFKYLVDSTTKYSCSDVKELVRTAASVCIRDLGLKIQDQSYKIPPISMDDFKIALNEVNTSVSAKDVDFHLKWNLEFGSYKIDVEE